jgi:hypothetical protein
LKEYLSVYWCIIVGKNPSMIEKLDVEGLAFELYIILLSFVAIVKPRTVTPSALNFRGIGIVRCGMFMG